MTVSAESRNTCSKCYALATTASIALATTASIARAAMAPIARAGRLVHLMPARIARELKLA
jgi:hypothetical protein